MQEQLREEKLLAEERQLTFRPSINHYYHTSRPRLCLSNPGPYLAHVQQRALKHRESLLHAEAKAEVGDDCRTFFILLSGNSTTAHVMHGLRVELREGARFT